MEDNHCYGNISINLIVVIQNSLSTLYFQNSSFVRQHLLYTNQYQTGVKIVPTRPIEKSK